MVMRPYDDPAWLQDQGVPLDQQGPLGKRPTLNSVMLEAGLQTDPEWQAEKERKKKATLAAEPPNPLISTTETSTPPQEVDTTAPTEGALAPDPVANPAQAIATQRTNYAAGQGRMGEVKRPEPPDYAAMLRDQEVTRARQVSFDNDKIPKWNESKAFNMGLINFGLNLLSGNDLANSFQMAGKTFEESYGREKREVWAEDLRSQGYDEHEIQAWIETGDNKLLTSMEDKEAKAMQLQMARYNLAKAKYETDPATMAYEAQREAMKDEIAVRQLGLSEEANARGWAQLQQSENQFNQRMAMEQAKLEAGPQFTSRDYSQIASAVMPTVKVNNQRITFSSNASKDLNDIDRYMQQGDSAGASASFKSFMGNQARAEKGGGATLTGKDAEAAVQIQHAIEQGKNLASLRVMGKPTQFWLESMRRSVADDLKNQVQTNREVAQDVYGSIAVEYGHDQAQKVVSRLFAGAGVGALRFDPNTGQLIERDLSKEKAKIKIIK